MKTAENHHKTTKELEQEFVTVCVHDSKIHECPENGRYTTYQTELKTNSLSFTKKHSIVQRTYSDFLWLRKALIKTTARAPPSLPPERLIGRFKQEYLNENEVKLTNFIQKVVKNTFFVSSAALHLFLQSDLRKNEMTALIRELNKRRGSMNALVRAKSLILSQSSNDTSFLDKEVSPQTAQRDSLDSVSSSSSSDKISFSYSDLLLEDSVSSNDEMKQDLLNNNAIKTENFIENKLKNTRRLTIDVEYPKWLFAESKNQISATKRSKSVASLPASRLSRSFTEVSWNFINCKKLPTKYDHLTSSPVRFSIGENEISKQTKTFSVASIKINQET